MGLELTSLHHVCQVVRRQVLETFKDMTLIFVVHKGSDKQEAIARYSDYILRYECGEVILKNFKKYAQANTDGFLGLVAEEPQKHLFLKKPAQAYALFFINMQKFSTPQEARIHLYHQAWHALDLHDRYKHGMSEKYGLSEGLVMPKETMAGKAMENMMADVFAAILMELEKGGDQIRKLAAERARMTLSPIKNYEAELYPFPVAMETAHLVMEDLRDTIDPGLKTVGQAVALTREVGMTHDEKSIRQWWAFSTRAQEMAWLGYSQDKILNAALYTSEDPYVKATAYLVADALDADTDMDTDTQFYNPFTEPEVNERNHNKNCERAFEEAMQHVLPVNDPFYFFEKAKQQNEKLMKGEISGWCAHALLGAERAYAYGLENGQGALESARQAFIELRTNFDWVKTQKLAHVIMKLRRIGFAFTPESLEQLGQKHPDLLPATEAMVATMTSQRLALKPQAQPVVTDSMAGMASMLPGYKDIKNQEKSAH